MSRRPSAAIFPAAWSFWAPAPASACRPSAAAARSARATIRSNNRTRCGLAIGLPGGNLLVDTPPDLRQQLLREQIGIVHAVLYTHEHADHIFGLDDLRLMQFYLGGPVPLYCEPAVELRIRKSFDYAFQSPERLHTRRHPAADVRDDRPGAV